MFTRSTRAALVLCSAIVCFSQDKSPEISTRDAPATFNSKVNLVMVPVIARDANGHAIGDLKKEDFQLFDKGKPQIISKFTIEKADGRVAPLEVKATEPGAAKTADAPPMASRFTAYLFDDMHTPFGDLAQARAAAIRHLAETLKGADRAAVYTTSGQNSLDFTDDREKLQETMNRIVPRSRMTHTAIDCPDETDYIADLILNKHDPIALGSASRDALACGAGNMTMAQSMAQATASQVLSVSEADAQVSLVVLKNAVQRMAAMPGQRSIVLVSSGFLVTVNYRQEELDAIDHAIRANVIISALDARGLYAVVPGGDLSRPATNSAMPATKLRYQTESAEADGDVLGELADGTGGTFFHNNNDLQEGFRRTGASPEFLYVLGFSPQNLKFDGTFHSLKVTVNGTKGLTLQARRGYFAPRHANDPADDAKEEIRVALFSRDEISDIPVELHTQFFKSTDKKARLSVLARVDVQRLHFRKADGRSLNTLSIVSAVFDRNGVLVGAVQKDLEMHLRDGTYQALLRGGVGLKTSFDVAPGSYIVRLVVRDSEGQMMAARNGVVEIP